MSATQKVDPRPFFPEVVKKPAARPDCGVARCSDSSYTLRLMRSGRPPLVSLATDSSQPIDLMLASRCGNELSHASLNAVPVCCRLSKTAEKWRRMPLDDSRQSHGKDCWYATTGVKELPSQARDCSLTRLAAYHFPAAMSLPHSSSLPYHNAKNMQPIKSHCRQICALSDHHSHRHQSPARHHSFPFSPAPETIWLARVL